jgi:WD40 repeat protein
MKPEVPFFVTGGTLAPDVPSYVTRSADSELLKALQDGAFCYVLNTRQVGKSSLMIRTAHALRRSGRATLVLDITAGGFNLTPESWYGGLILQLAEQLARWLGRPELEDRLEEAFLARPDLGAAHRFFYVLESVALPEAGELTVFIDEIDAVRLLPFSADELFVGIRALYNRRAEMPELNGLTFCLIGVATPPQLISSPLVSPFNIGQKIVLSDFTLADARLLTPSLPGGRATLERVLHWTGGHPYLTQKLCASLSETRQSVDDAVKSLYLAPAARESDDNLAFVAARLLRGEEDPSSVLDLYGRVRIGQPVPDDPTSSVCDALHLSGIVRPGSDGKLQVRNRIYGHVFSSRWVRESLPEGERRRQRAAFFKGVARAGALAGTLIAAMGGLTAWAVLSARRADTNARLADQNALRADQNATAARRSQRLAGRNQQRAERLAQERAVALVEKEKALRGRETALREREAALKDRETALTAERTARQRAGEAEQTARRNLGRAELALALRALGKAETELAAERLESALRPELLTPERRAMALFCREALKSCAPRLAWRRELGGVVSALRYSPDGRRLLLGTLDGQVRLLDATTGRSLGESWNHGASVWAVAFLPDGRVASGGNNGQVRLWGGRRSLPPLVHVAPPGDVFHLAPSRDGRRLISSGRGGSVVWDCVQGRELSRVWDDDLGGRWSAQKPSPIVATYESRFVAPDESRLVFAAYGYLCNIADVSSGKMIQPFSTTLDSLKATPDWIYQFVPTPDPKVFAVVGHYRSGSGGGGACLYELETGRARSLLMTCKELPRCGGLAPDGALLALGDESGSLTIWDARAGLLRGGPYPLHTDRPLLNVSWLPDSDRLLTRTALGDVLLWSYADRRVVGTRFRDSVAFELSKNGQQAVVPDSRGNIALWNLPPRTRSSVLRISLTEREPLGETVPLDSYAWASWLEEASESALVIDLKSRRLLRLSQLPGRPMQVDFAPERRFLAVRATNGISLWNLATGRTFVSRPGTWSNVRWEKDRAVLTRPDGSQESILLPT